MHAGQRGGCNRAFTKDSAHVPFLLKQPGIELGQAEGSNIYIHVSAELYLLPGDGHAFQSKSGPYYQDHRMLARVPQVRVCRSENFGVGDRESSAWV